MTQPKFKSFNDWFRATSDAAIDSKIGTILNDRYWRVAHAGGNLLAWQLDSEDERHYAWITLDEEYDGEESDELGTGLSDSEVAPFICGIYKLDDDGSVTDEWINKVATGITAAMDWCEAALKLSNPLKAEV